MSDEQVDGARRERAGAGADGELLRRLRELLSGDAERDKAVAGDCDPASQGVVGREVEPPPQGRRTATFVGPAHPPYFRQAGGIPQTPDCRASPSTSPSSSERRRRRRRRRPTGMAGSRQVKASGLWATLEWVRLTTKDRPTQAAHPSPVGWGKSPKPPYDRAQRAAFHSYSM